jgi:predicted anti-sigma-YlaC factor YlaD
MNCESFLDYAAGFLDGSLASADREAVSCHLAECADCRALLSALEATNDPGLADAILARTSGTACESAGSRLCDRVDGHLDPFDAELVDAHLYHCHECGALARVLRALHDDLPGLASIDPGPGFVDAVVARTSRRPRRVAPATRWASVVSRLLDRPRIALEGAFVAAVVVGLPLAATPGSIDVAPAAAFVDARGAMTDVEVAVHVGARTAWASAHAFVAERLQQGTFARPGASGQKGGTKTTAQENKR